MSSRRDDLIPGGPFHGVWIRTNGTMQESGFTERIYLQQMDTKILGLYVHEVWEAPLPSSLPPGEEVAISEIMKKFYFNGDIADNNRCIVKGKYPGVLELSDDFLEAFGKDYVRSAAAPAAGTFDRPPESPCTSPRGEGDALSAAAAAIVPPLAVNE